MQIKIRTTRNFQGFYNAYLEFVTGFGSTTKQIVWDARDADIARMDAEQMLLLSLRPFDRINKSSEELSKN